MKQSLKFLTGWYRHLVVDINIAYNLSQFVIYGWRSCLNILFQRFEFMTCSKLKLELEDLVSVWIRVYKCAVWCNNLLLSVCKGGTGEKERAPISHESFLLMANSQTDMDDWVKAIRRVIWAPFGGGERGREEGERGGTGWERWEEAWRVSSTKAGGIWRWVCGSFSEVGDVTGWTGRHEEEELTLPGVAFQKRGLLIADKCSITHSW